MILHLKTKKNRLMTLGHEAVIWDKDLAATYSRGSYTTTTIGKTVFDGRVRDGNGSVHSFMTTKKLFVSPGAVLGAPGGYFKVL